MTTTLEVTKREERGKALSGLRAGGKVPGVLYGAKEENTAIAIDAAALKKLLTSGEESGIITLAGLDDEKEVLIQDVAFDPVRGEVAHIDFLAIERGKELTTDVPLEFTGEAPALKLGGTLSKAMHELEVTCLPRNLPQHIEVDLSTLEVIGASIHVSDLVLPEGVSTSAGPEDVVASVIEVTEEPEEEAPTEVDMDAIEVEGKGKEEAGEAEDSDES